MLKHSALVGTLQGGKNCVNNLKYDGDFFMRSVTKMNTTVVQKSVSWIFVGHAVHLMLLIYHLEETILEMMLLQYTINNIPRGYLQQLGKHPANAECPVTVHSALLLDQI